MSHDVMRCYSWCTCQRFAICICWSSSWCCPFFEDVTWKSSFSFPLLLTWFLSLPLFFFFSHSIPCLFSKATWEIILHFFLYSSCLLLFPFLKLFKSSWIRESLSYGATQRLIHHEILFFPTRVEKRSRESERMSEVEVCWGRLEATRQKDMNQYFREQ